MQIRLALHGVNCVVFLLVFHLLSSRISHCTFCIWILRRVKCFIYNFFFLFYAPCLFSSVCNTGIRKNATWLVVFWQWCLFVHPSGGVGACWWHQSRGHHLVTKQDQRQAEKWRWDPWHVTSRDKGWQELNIFWNIYLSSKVVCVWNPLFFGGFWASVSVTQPLWPTKREPCPSRRSGT